MKMDLLCSVNIIPRTIIIKPMITNDLLTDLFRFINYRYPQYPFACPKAVVQSSLYLLI
jgi:hypothetical protein